MKILAARLAYSGLPVRASFVLAMIWLLVSCAINLSSSSSWLAQADLAVYSVAGSVAILIAGLALQKVLEAAAR